MATSSSKQFINPKQPIFRPLSIPTSNPNPRTRGRKSGCGSGSANNTTKSKNDTKDKPRRRGVGMAELERLRRLNDHHSSSSPPPPNDSRVNPTLPGIPLIHYCIPGQPVLDPTLTLRVAGMPSESSSSYNELPSIPNSFHFDHSPLFSFKKKRVIGEEVVGFAKGYNGNFNGYDLNNYNGDNNNHYLAVNEGFSANTVPTTGSEIVAIHKKWSGSMMEYGFFPKKSEKSDSSPSSSSSSLSSLTTATTTTNSIDLSLKLSSYY